jgi:hypothetical protein
MIAFALTVLFRTPRAPRTILFAVYRFTKRP